ncbi:MAG: HAD-IC family P-type ATPase, partial [Atribacterota bacterium]
MYPQAKPTLTDNPNSEKEEETKDDRKLWTMGISFFLLIIGLVYRNPLHAGSFHFFEYLLFFSAYLLVGWKVIWVAFQNIFHGQVFDEHFLMTLATLGAFVVHEMPEAVGVMLFYAAGEYLEDLAVGKSRRSIRHLLSIRSEVANLEKNGKIEPVSPEKVQVGENILVRPGERVPLDGVVLGGESSLDTSALTGESVPQEVKAGSQVLAGMINGHGLLKVQVSRLFQESSVAKILSLVQDAASHKSSTERFITRFSRYYTPIVVFGALAFATIPPLLNSNTHFSDWIYRALILLVISCPCALVISIPLGFFGGLGAASRAGILVKG